MAGKPQVGTYESALTPKTLDRSSWSRKDQRNLSLTLCPQRDAAFDRFELRNRHELAIESAFRSSPFKHLPGMSRSRDTIPAHRQLGA